jgi:ribosomal protein S12 methylthiotransferase accessory factor
MAVPQALEIDLASAPGLDLLRSVAVRHGEPIAQAAHLMDRLFLLRSPWAPGLRFVGAQATARVNDSAPAPPRSFDLGGTGETIEDAFASCVGEGVDRLAQVERPGDVATVASLRNVGTEVMPAAVALIEQHLADDGLSADAPLAWTGSRMLSSGKDGAGHNVLVPSDWCLRRADRAVRLKARTMLGNGVAAGPDVDWAASRALLELIERDAASLWWIGGRRGRPVALDEPGQPEVVRLLGALRRDAGERSTWLLDITTDIATPCVAALSCAADGRGLACGLAARTTMVEAACSAILELCQMELAIQLAAAKRLASGDTSLNDVDRAHLRRACDIDVGSCELLHPLGIPQSYPSHSAASMLAAARIALAKAGIEAALVDLTRPEFGIPVVRAIAPALQPMPSEAVTLRLRQVLSETGGGHRHTNGVPLM